MAKFVMDSQSKALAELKRKMENREADFHRIPMECDLDMVECVRRIERMVKAKIRYHLALKG